MKETARLQELLSQLEFKYTYRKLNEDIEEFEIVVDAEDDLRLSGLLYHADEECFFRLYGYVDELDKDNALEQLSKLMALNLDMPAGAYCLDAEEEVVLVTLNMAFGTLTPESLSWGIEFCVASQDIFYDEYYPEEPEDIAKG